MTDHASLEDQLRLLLPSDMHAAIPVLVSEFSALLSQKSALTQAKERLAALDNIAEVLQHLANRQLTTPLGQLNFGSGSQLGDVSVGDVAGGSIYKLSVPIQNNGTVIIVQAGAQVVLNNQWGYATDAMVPLSTILPDHLPTVYIAQGGIETALGAELARQIQIRGMQVMHAPPIDQVAHSRPSPSLAHTSAVVIIITPETLSEMHQAGAYFLFHELPILRERFAQPAPLWVLPILCGVTADQVRVMLSRRHLALPELRVVELPPTDNLVALRTAITPVARTLMQALLPPRLHALVAPSAKLAIDFFSYAPTHVDDHAALRLNWTPYFPSRDLPDPPPDPTLWAQVLLPALSDLRDCVGNVGLTHIQLNPAAHLSVGVAFGYHFLRVAHFHLTILQTTRDRLFQWSSLVDPTETAPPRLATDPPDPLRPGFDETAPPANDKGPDISVEVNITRFIERDVTDFLEANHLPIGRRIGLHLPGGPRQDAIFDTRHARDLAEQIADLIRNKRDAVGAEPVIHLFLAAPFALAALLGRLLNQCGPIQCYEEKAKVYYPSCILTNAHNRS